MPLPANKLLIFRGTGFYINFYRFRAGQQPPRLFLSPHALFYFHTCAQFKPARGQLNPQMASSEFQFNITLAFHLRENLQICVQSWGLQIKNLNIFCPQRKSCIFHHLILLDIVAVIWWKLQSTKLYIINFLKISTCYSLYFSFNWRLRSSKVHIIHFLELTLWGCILYYLFN